VLKRFPDFGRWAAAPCDSFSIIFMRGFILALVFHFSLVHPAAAGGAVEKMLDCFDRLRTAETAQAAHRPVPHVETRFTDGEVNEYLIHTLKTTPRPRGQVDSRRVHG
jgi:hypothetical protein